MTYVAWELSAGEALKTTAAYCRHAARGPHSTFTSTTVPTLEAVERWLTSSYYWINFLLSSNGYSTTQNAVAVVHILQELNVLDVCVKIELSLPEESASGEPNQRFLEFVNRRAELIKMITGGALASNGAVLAAVSRAPHIGGELYSRKSLLENNPDAVQHRIRRNGLRHPDLKV